MPLSLGLAMSHAPSMFAEVRDWPAIYGTLTRGEPRVSMFEELLRDFVPVPQPAEAAEETPEKLVQYLQRIDRAIARLREQLAIHEVETLIIVGDDQGEYFKPERMPTFCIFIAEEITGTQSIYILGEPEEKRQVKIRSNPDLARYLCRRLVEEGFDLCWDDGRHASGRLKNGLGHAFFHPLIKLMPELDIPLIPFHVNAYFEPMPTARRCYELGRAIARALEGRPERVALCASGGLSHDPFGPRSGWIDKELDQWVLEQLREGRGEALCHLFTFKSETLHGGTGEIRSWIVVAGAFEGVKAEVVDYIPVHHSVTGLGFAYWSRLGLGR